MNSNILKLLFLTYSSRINKKGLTPLLCRLTYKNRRKQISTGLFIDPNYWDRKKQTYTKLDDKYINTQISLISQNINQAFLFLQIQLKQFDTEDIYNQYIGKTLSKDFGVVEYYCSYLDKLKKLVGIEIKLSTYNKYFYIKNDIIAFIKWKYKKNEILLKNLDLEFLIEFEFYSKTQKKSKQVTINKNIQRFKSVIKNAVISKHIDYFPFSEHKPKKINTKIVYLTQDELKMLENYKFSQKRLEAIQEMFLFCCYTGLAFHEMSTLENRHIIVDNKSNNWIVITREKTQKEISVPILLKPLEILKSFQIKAVSDRIFPKISNQKFNSYLKEIAEIIGIEKNLTHHIARKTFATTVLLYNDVPIEIVSELLGHSSIRITQEHYAKVLKSKVSEQMERISKKLNPESY